MCRTHEAAGRPAGPDRTKAFLVRRGREVRSPETHASLPDSRASCRPLRVAGQARKPIENARGYGLTAREHVEQAHPPPVAPVPMVRQVEPIPHPGLQARPPYPAAARRVGLRCREWTFPLPARYDAVRRPVEHTGPCLPLLPNSNTPTTTSLANATVPA
jgi:hypothetical protein